MDIFNEIVAGEQRETEKRKINFVALFFKFLLLCVILLSIGAFIVWRNMADYSVPVAVSKKTTYLTEPINSDGGVDYFLALEQKVYPPGMKTDENGYRMVAQALGPARELTDPERVKIFYDKLGLDPEAKPTHPQFVSPIDYLNSLSPKDKVSNMVFEKPWNLEQMPQMKDWFDKHNPTLDLVAKAVRKESFRIPYVKKNNDYNPEDWLCLETTLLSIGKGYQARANFRIESGNIDGAIDDIISCRRLGCFIGSQGLFIDVVLGLSVERSAQSVGIAGSLEHQPTEEQLTRLLTEINELPPRFNFDDIAECERYFVLGHLTQMSLLRDKWDEIGNLGQVSKVSKIFACDWNVVFERFNENYDHVLQTGDYKRFELKTKDYFNIKKRSILLADEFSENLAAFLGEIKNGVHLGECREKMQRITLAILLYNAKNGELPSEYTCDPQGRKLHSWRVNLLPYLKLPEADELYEKIALDEQWDASANMRFHEAVIPFYQCPANGNGVGNTSFALIVGENLAFNVGIFPKTMSDLPQDGDDMIFVTETTASNNWMNPVFDVHEAFASAETIKHNTGSSGISSEHKDGANLGLRNGAVRFYPDSTTLEELRDLIVGK